MIRTVICAVGIGIASVCLAPTAVAQAPFANCTQAKDQGYHDILKGDPNYWPGGDRDGDGIACES